MYRLLAFSFLLAFATAQNWDVIGNAIESCSGKDMLTCLQMKAISGLDRASRSDNLSVMDSVTLVRTEPREEGRDGRSLTEPELQEAAAQGTITDIFWDRLARFMGSHTIQVALPKVSPQELQTGVEEGRGKMKKMMSMMLMAGMMKAATMIPIKLGALFLLAGKALIVSKLALVLSLIILLKKLMSKGDEHGHSSSGWSAGGGSGSGWDRRSIRVVHADLPYRGYKP